MFIIQYMTQTGSIANISSGASSEYAARKAIAALPDCDSIVYCEPMPAPAKNGTKS